ncbi:MAG: hypothetical protein WCA19_02205 [Candidatus Acidiferrales bacterium]
MKLKELPWGEDQTCIYVNGHVGPIHFLASVKAFLASGVPQDARDALVLDDVKHTRFTRMSPTECARQGFDWGFWEQKDGRYKVTAVFI